MLCGSNIGDKAQPHPKLAAGTSKTTEKPPAVSETPTTSSKPTATTETASPYTPQHQDELRQSLSAPQHINHDTPTSDTTTTEGTIAEKKQETDTITTDATTSPPWTKYNRGWMGLWPPL